MFVHVNLLANLILKTYFTRSNCLLIFIENQEKFEYTGNLPFLIYNLHNKTFDIKIVFRYHGCQGLIIFGENPKGIFEQLELEIRRNLERFNNRKYLIYSKNFDIFQSDALEYVSDFLMIKDAFNFCCDLYTHRYIGNETYRKEIIEIDRWFPYNKTFSKNSSLYPNKLKTQFGRDLRIATFTYAPYSIPGNRDGTEIFIALEFCKRYNMTLKLIVDEVGEWGESYNNWTGYGILGNLVRDESDLGLGALYIWEHEYYFLDITKSCLRSSITSIVPAPELIGGLITPFISFSWEMWIMSIVSFMVAFFAIFEAITFDHFSKDRNIHKTENLVKSFMLTEAIFLLQGLSKIPSNSKSRIIIALTLLLSLLMSTLYSSGLASNMTVPRYKGVIRNVKDLAESNLQWGATSVAWVSALFDDENPIYKKVVNNFVGLNFEELSRKNEEDFGYAVERLTSGNYAIGKYITSEGIQRRRLMDEDVDREHVVMMMRKSSILLPLLDKLILEIAQAGLIYIWEYKVTVRTSDMKHQKAVRLSLHTGRPDKTKLNLSHVEGAFALWCLGISFSFIIFIGEIFYRKERKIIVV